MSSKPGFWRKCRIAFRCARFTVWVVVLLLLAAFGWFNVVGLPGFLKTRLVKALHERGVQLEFSRLRLRLVHGLICDNVRLGEAEAANGPVLTAHEVQLRVNLPALLRGHMEVDGLVLRRGQLALPVSATNSLAVTNLETELRFSGDDTWSLDRFSADFAGANFLLAGEIKHATEFRSWTMFSGTKSPDRGSTLAAMKNLSDTLAKIHFEGKPQFSLRLNGDARDARSFSLGVTVRAPLADTPWFNARKMEFAARLTAAPGAPVSANPSWGFWTNLQPFRLEWTGHATNLESAPIHGAVECAGLWNPSASALHFTVAAPMAKTPWFSARDLQFDAQVTVATNAAPAAGPASGFWTNLQPFHIEWSGRATHLESAPVNAGAVASSGVWSAPELTVNITARRAFGNSPQYKAQDLQFAASVSLPAQTPPAADPAWGFWTNLEPFRIEWTSRITNLEVAQIKADRLECLGVWSAPELAVTRLNAALGGGTLEATTKLSVPTREVAFNVQSSFDPHLIAPALAENARSRLAQISWRQPPWAQVTGSVIVPPWSGEATAQADELGSSIRLQGEVGFTNALVNDLVPVDRMHTHFSYKHRVWRLADLDLTSGKTSLQLKGEEDEATRNFQCTIGASLDGDSVRPFLLSSNAVHGYGLLAFHQPVVVALDVNGNLGDFRTLFATGSVTATEFAIRNQGIDSVSAKLSYTNLTADFYQPRLLRASGAERFTADKVTLDISGEKLFIYGGEGHVSPAAVGAAIGPKTAEAMEPYHFLAIPSAKVDGCIPLKHVGDDLVPDDADIWFEVEGTSPFRWKRFQTPEITGRIHWLSKYLILTNVVSECYGGQAHGWAKFDLLTPGDGTDFSFYMSGANVNFQSMGMALWSPTNQLRGSLAGTLMVTKANSSDWHTWNGLGQAELRGGLLWDAPIFGLMSPIVNRLTPGLDLGSSRATDGTGHFTMTNGVIFTDSLELRSLTMRLNYIGTVDLDENVQARVTAQLLRNAPVLGTLFSTVLWPVSKAFECQVTGTLDKPKITPLYIPKMLSAPLHPIRSMEQLFNAPTNSPPQKP